MPHPKPGRSAAPPAGSPRLGDARRRQRAGTGRICSVRSAKRRWQSRRRDKAHSRSGLDRDTGEAERTALLQLIPRGQL